MTPAILRLLSALARLRSLDEDIALERLAVRRDPSLAVELGASLGVRIGLRDRIAVVIERVDEAAVRGRLRGRLAEVDRLAEEERVAAGIVEEEDGRG